MDLAILFVSAFAASTILPMSSEVVLGTLAHSGSSEVWLLLAVAHRRQHPRRSGQLGAGPLFGDLANSPCFAGRS